MIRKMFVCIVIWMAIGLPVSALELTIIPGFGVPLGSTDSDTPNPYGFGAGVYLGLGHTLTTPSWLYLEGGLGYYGNSTDGGENLSRLNFEGGAGASLYMGPRLNFKALAFAGGSQGFYQGGTGTYAVFGARLQLGYVINPTFSLGLGTSYRYTPNLYHGLSVVLTAGINFSSGRESRAIEFQEIQTEPVFPILYQYYDENTFGSASFTNAGRGTINDGVIHFFAPSYMSVPKVCGRFDSLGKDDELTFALSALFSEDILTIIEDKKISAEITVQYTYLGNEYENAMTQPVLVHNRNALTWTDDTKVAAFISGKDPQVMRFARNSAGIADDGGFANVNKPFRQGMAVLEALRVHGITYVPDPKTPYKEFSTNTDALDYIQFPSQALAYRSGDCDDLTILYNSLLESLAVETAFITVPGHILPAFSVDMWPAEAEKFFGDDRNLIYMDDTTWIPVEITALRQGFLRAWELGGKQWREADAAGEAVIYRTHESWNTYQAVARPASETEIVELPDQDDLLLAYENRIEKFVSASISAREQELLTEIRSGRNPERSRNALGVLYARHGLLDKAYEEFMNLPRTPRVNVNLGNIAFLQEEMAEASRFYQSALAEDPDNRAALLGFSRSRYEAGDFRESEEAYITLIGIAPELADRYAYLGGAAQSTRAASAEAAGYLLWDE